MNKLLTKHSVENNKIPVKNSFNLFVSMFLVTFSINKMIPENKTQEQKPKVPKINNNITKWS